MQDAFLSACRRDKKAVTVYLVNGVKLQGTIIGFDETSLVLKRSLQSQLVYKHSIATVVPTMSDTMADGLDDALEGNDLTPDAHEPLILR